MKTELFKTAPPEDIAASNLRVHWRMVRVLLVLNLLDIISTYWALHIGAIEGNPLSSFLITWQLLIPLKLSACFFALWVSYRSKSLDGASLAGVGFAVGVYALVIVLNTITLAHYFTH